MVPLNLVILLLVLTSVPIGLLSLSEFSNIRSTRSILGMLASAWSAGGVVAVMYGVPGTIFFPGLLLISLAGGAIELRASFTNARLARMALTVFLLAFVSIGLVFV